LKVLLLYDYPPPPGGLATQGELLHQGLHEIGVEAHATNIESVIEKEWYYRWFHPDVVLGVGYWGKTPQVVLHPHQFGMTAVPWLVADGYIANYQDILNSLPLILVTSHWVKEVYTRDGIRPEIIEVLPVGCDTDRFIPYPVEDPKVAAVRRTFGVGPEELMILTVGGDAASKGGREVMEALAKLKPSERGGHAWKYICKVWPQERTTKQNQLDQALVKHLGISTRVTYSTDRISRDLMPFLLSACDIYAAPSRLEGFGMTQVEAGACGKPVLSLAAMGMLDTLVHNETALLAGIAKKNYIHETTLGPEDGFPMQRHITFDPPRIADYRADVNDLRLHLGALMRDPDLRRRLGEAGRRRVVEHFDYRTVAKQFVEILKRRLDLP